MSSKTTKTSLCPVGNGKIKQIFKIVKPKTLLTEYHKTACHLLFISNYICTGNAMCYVKKSIRCLYQLKTIYKNIQNGISEFNIKIN